MHISTNTQARGWVCVLYTPRDGSARSIAGAHCRGTLFATYVQHVSDFLGSVAVRTSASESGSKVQYTAAAAVGGSGVVGGCVPMCASV